jgi:hypothetical protein
VVVVRDLFSLGAFFANRAKMDLFFIIFILGFGSGWLLHAWQNHYE